MAANEIRSGDVDKIKDDLQRLRDDIGKLLGHVGSYSKGKLGDAREKVSATMEDLQDRTYDRMQGATRGVADRTWQAASVSRDKVQKKPLASLAVAFVAGLIFASIFVWKK